MTVIWPNVTFTPHRPVYPALAGLVRYEYKCNIIEECRRDGKEHGLRVVCTQMGKG